MRRPIHGRLLIGHGLNGHCCRKRLSTARTPGDRAGGDRTRLTARIPVWRHFTCGPPKRPAHFPRSYGELEEIMDERRVEVEHTTLYRWT